LLAMAQGLARGMTLRAGLIESLAADRTLDLAIILCSETHMARHYLARPAEIAPGVSNLDLIARVLRPLDAAWPRILAAAGEETTVLLFALHGMHHQVDYSPIAPQLIALALGRDPASAVPRPDLLRRIRDAIPDPVHRAIWQRLPARIRAARQAAINLRGINPAGEPLFPVGHDGDPAIRVSLRGREAAGVVDPAEAPALLDRLAAVAARFRTPDGQPAYADTLRIPERFPGPRADRLPDLLLLANREVVAVSHLLDDGGIRLVNPSREARNGIHTGTGFCFVRPAAGLSPTVCPADARDFAPTFHQLLGVPTFADLEACLATVEADALLVLSPPACHAAHVDAGLAAGLHVLVEKPPALRLADAAGWERPPRGSVTAAFTRRLWPGYRQPPPPGPAEWRLLLETDPAAWGARQPSPVEHDLLPHAIDLARWLTGADLRRPAALQLGHGRLSGRFDLPAGGTFQWEVGHAGGYRERLTRDGRTLASYPRRGVPLPFRRRTPHDVAAVADFLAAWAATLRPGAPPDPRLPTSADLAAVVGVIEAVTAP
uniref:Gfo/Idh/MocA family oxidoreductase n=1 Tax=Tepidiforma sp. TaxID=2682230 RepID=UPI002ADD3F97